MPRLLLDSLDRLSGSTTSAAIIPLVANKHRFRSITLESVTLINGLVSIVSGSNSIFYQTVGPIRTATIPVGNYTATSLATQVAAQMLISQSTDGKAYTCTYNSVDQAFTITCTATMSLFMLTAGAMSANMGFEPATYSGTTFTGTRWANLSTPNYLILDIQEFGKHVWTSYVASPLSGTFIVPLIEVKTGLVFATTQDTGIPQKIHFVSPISPTLLNISFKDRTGAALSNLAEWQILLHIDFDELS